MPLRVENNPPRTPGQSYDVYYSTNRSLDTNRNFVVPEGNYMVMGDNRNDSDDSRFPDVGFVPRENLIGHAVRIWMNWQIPGWPRWGRIGMRIQ